MDPMDAMRPMGSTDGMTNDYARDLVDTDAAAVEGGSDRLILGGCARIFVQRQWNDWRKAEVFSSDLHGAHWRHPAGASRPLLHAYVSCAKVQSGAIPHRCDIRSAPHWLLVCILRRHTVGAVYDELTRVATAAGDAALFSPSWGDMTPSVMESVPAFTVAEDD